MSIRGPDFHGPSVAPDRRELATVAGTNPRPSCGFARRPLQESANPCASVFDILAHSAGGFPDLRPRPYTERRQVLLDVLAGLGPTIVAVWSTTDLAEALLWYESLEGTGVEGIVAKPLRSAYRAGRVWCVDCTISAK
ncbi:hypothetical protein [Streptomyces sp. NPDC020747]|uniref:ATP-dependent DNA ligase n=1 Tax=Streptomyces sp. NPDC020747 TaxID=3365086 RepID=UPI0037959792